MWRMAWSAWSSCRSSITSHSGSRSELRSSSNRPTTFAPSRCRGGRQLPHPFRSGTGLAQRVENGEPEHLRIVLLTPHRHPRRAVAETLRGDPGAQQERLPASRRCRHVHHPLRRAQQLEQAGPRDQPRPHTGVGVFDGCSRVGHDTHGCTLPPFNQTVGITRTMRCALTRQTATLITCQPTRERPAVASRGATRSASAGRSARR